MLSSIRRFLIFEGMTFLVAALVHAGVLVSGYAHREATIAETVIGLVLIGGAGLTWVAPRWSRLIGLLVQAFALLGTLVGVFTIVIGIGPRSVPDIVYHLVIVAVLLWGLTVAAGQRLPTAVAAQ